MYKRRGMSRGGSKRNFRRNSAVHPRNFNLGNPMRGGIRM